MKEFEGALAGFDEKQGQSKEEIGRSSVIEETDEEIFQSYMENLRLKPEDFEKRILDVGAGSAQFAKWAREHGVSSSITSLDIRPGGLREKTKGVGGDAERLPFADGSFDMAVSSYSMPHAAPWSENEMRSPDVLRQKIGGIFSEMLRVVGEKGEIRLAGVPIGGSDPRRKELRQSISEELEALKKKPGVSVRKIPIGSHDRSNSYLLIINKGGEGGA